MRRSRPGAFTIIELLIVIGVIAVLAGLLLPALRHSKYVAWEVSCASNMRQIYYALAVYSNNNSDYYPLEQHEHNPHRTLLEALDAYSAGKLIDAFYCPQAMFMENAAKNTSCPPKGKTDSVVDTPENREAGNISYVYWSFLKNKPGWRGTPFFPRILKATGMQPVPAENYQSGNDSKAPYLTQPEYAERAKNAPLSRIWVLTDFFRRKAPIFPHVRGHAGGLNVLFLDGHVELVIGRPRNNYQ